MRSTKKLTLIKAAVLAAGIALPGAANAADLLVDPPVVEAPEVVTKASGGWYLRGDIGYSFRNNDSPMFVQGNGATVGTCGVICDVSGDPRIGYRSFTGGELENGINLRGGIGYQVTDYFRVDATADYSFNSEFSGSTVSDGNCFTGDTAPFGGATAGTSCRSTDTDNYKAVRLLANAYIDLANVNGFTPYIGAGIGGAHVSYDGLTNTTECVGSAANCAFTPGTTVNHPGEDSWRFAWAIHAGFAYELTHKLKVDVGYSYNRITEGPMFGLAQQDIFPGQMGGTQGFDKGIDEHTVRVGLRYHLW